MALEALKLTTAVNWTFVRTPTGFKAFRQKEGKSYEPAIDVATIDQCYIAIHTIAAAGTVTIDLKSFTNLVMEAAQALATATTLYVLVEPTGDPGGYLTIEPGAANGLEWFWGADPLEVTDHIAYHRATGTTVDATHKTLLLTNAGTEEIEVFILIAGT